MFFNNYIILKQTLKQGGIIDLKKKDWTNSKKDKDEYLAIDPEVEYICNFRDHILIL